MNVKAHVYSSGLLGTAVYAVTRSAEAAMSTAVSGVLIDLDHVLDFFLFSGERFSLRSFFSWCNEPRWQKITLLLHSYELYGALCAGVFCLSPSSPILKGILFGTGLHLLLDEIGNRYVHKTFRLAPAFYFLTYRAAVGFRHKKLRIDSPSRPTGPGVKKDAQCQ